MGGRDGGGCGRWCVDTATTTKKRNEKKKKAKGAEKLGAHHHPECSGWEAGGGGGGWERGARPGKKQEKVDHTPFFVGRWRYGTLIWGFAFVYHVLCRAVGHSGRRGRSATPFCRHRRSYSTTVARATPERRFFLLLGTSRRLIRGEGGRRRR